MTKRKNDDDHTKPEASTYQTQNSEDIHTEHQTTSRKTYCYQGIKGKRGIWYGQVSEPKTKQA